MPASPALIAAIKRNIKAQERRRAQREIIIETPAGYGLSNHPTKYIRRRVK